MLIFMCILLVVVVALVIWIINIYNHLVTLLNRVENTYAQIKVQLKRRYDLIPNLVNTAKGYMEFEKDTLTKVTQLREQGLNAINNDNIGEINEIEKTLNPLLKGLTLRIEAYPELKSNTVVMQFTEELVTTENRISSSRQVYNDCCNSYNTYKEQFPNFIIANKSEKFTKKAQLLEFEEDSKTLNQAPKVEF